MEKQGDILIREAYTKGDLCDILLLAAYHTQPMYDCTLNYYKEYIAERFGHPNWKMWIAKDNKSHDVTGYIIAFKDISGLCSQVNIFDIFILDGNQGGGIGKQLMNAAYGWAKTLRVKRIKWNSQVHPKVWQRLYKEEAEQTKKKISYEYVLYGEIQ